MCGMGELRFHGQAVLHERFAGDAHERHVAQAQGLHLAFNLAVHQRRSEVGKRLVRPLRVCDGRLFRPQIE